MKEPQTVVLSDKKLTCHHCGNDTFHVSKAQLNTSGMSFLGLDFLNHSASTFICSECGFVHWFHDVDPLDKEKWG